jgi:hypothetical protein
MITQPDSTHRRDQGMALFLAVFILTLVSMVALAGIQNSENEATSSGRSRASMRMLHAADAGIEFAASRVAKNNFASFSLDLGGGRNVESRRRSDPNPINISEAGRGLAPEGFAIPSGAGSTGYVTDVYLVNVTATSANGSVVELESKLGILAVDGGGY